MSKIVNEAMIDARELIKLAESNAKSAIVETFQPQIQRMISTKLAEDGDDMEDEELPVEDPLSAPVATDSFADQAAAPVAAAPTAPVAPVADPAVEAEPLVDVPVEDEDEDAAYEAIVRELNSVTETEDDTMLDGEEELNIDDLELEAFIRKIKEGDDCADDDYDDSKDAPVMEQIKKLKKENAELAKANILMKNAIQEAVLLNTKLMYSIQIGREYGLNESEKVTVFKALDKAKSINEVKLVHSTLTESFKTRKVQNRKDAAISKPSIAKTMASRSQPVVQSNKTAVNEGVEKIKNRWQILSGQQKIKY